MELIREGRVWKFGDVINTDLIYPTAAFRLPEAEQFALVFSANRPGWVSQVRPGDLIVAGANFGMGSGRPVGAVLKGCGIVGIVAESINGLCLRNCINYSLPAMQCQGVADAFSEGDVARVDYVNGLVQNITTGRHLKGTGLPELLVGIVAAGGVVPMLANEGYIDAGVRQRA